MPVKMLFEIATSNYNNVGKSMLLVYKYGTFCGQNIFIGIWIAYKHSTFK